MKIGDRIRLNGNRLEKLLAQDVHTMSGTIIDIMQNPEGIDTIRVEFDQHICACPFCNVYTEQKTTGNFLPDELTVIGKRGNK
jgi:hypothetical protein